MVAPAPSDDEPRAAGASSDDRARPEDGPSEPAASEPAASQLAVSGHEASGHEASERERGERLERMALQVGVALLFLPWIVAVLCRLLWPELDATPTGDEAPFEARVLTLAHPPALVGPYSRHHWHHPGPLAFWLLGVPYHLFGRAPLALRLTSALLQLGCLAAVVRSALRLRTDAHGRAIALAALALLVSVVSSADAPSGLVAIWNPVLTLLPYAALLFLSAELAEGAFRRLVPITLLHALLVQSHLAYALPASIAWAGALALALRRHGLRAEARAHIGGAALALAVVWAPVAYDAVAGSGNVGALVRYFVGQRSEDLPVGWREAPVLFAWRASAWLRAIVTRSARDAEPRGDDPGHASSEELVVAGVLSLLLVLAWAWAAARPRADASRTIRTLLGLCVAQLAVGLLALHRVDDPSFAYHTWWLTELALVATLVAALALVPPPRSARGGRAALVIAAALVLALTTRTALEERENGRGAAEQAARARDAIEPLLPALERALACRAHARLSVPDHELWGVLGALLVRLGREGAPVGLDESWAFMFGPGFPPEHEGPTLLVSARPIADCAPLTASDGLQVLVCDADSPGPAPVEETLRLAVWGAERAAGALDALIDGRAADDGAPWNEDGTVVLGDTRASITLGLPVARLTRVAVTADDNDVLALEGSADGVLFAPLAELAPGHRFGQRRRELVLDPPRVLRALRLRAVSGDGLYGVSELSASGVREAVRLSEVEGLDGDPAVLSDGRALEDPSPCLLARGRRVVTATLPAVAVDGLAITTDPSSRWRIEGSVDGVGYGEIAQLEPIRGDGLVTRRVHFGGDALWSVVRLSLTDDAPPARLAELAVIARPGVALDVGTPEARAALRSGWSGDESAGEQSWVWAVGHEATLALPASHEPSTLLVAVAPLAGLRERQRVTLRTADATTSAWLESGTTTLRLPLAPQARDDLEVVLAFSEATSPRELGVSDDARPLAAAVHRVELRPEPSLCP